MLDPSQRRGHDRSTDRRADIVARLAVGRAVPHRTAAEPLSTALRRRRGTRAWCGSGANELALQFEFVNKADRPITPDTLGIDQYERVLMLVDLPRSTAYETLTAQGNDGRISESATASRCPREERSR